jgi:sporulation protein YlmC with PRC-barrel domain
MNPDGMNPERVNPSRRVGLLLGRPVYDRSGNRLGRLADLETRRDPHGQERISAVIVTAGPWGRLLGYERAEVGGPWLLERLARIVLRRTMRRVPWSEARLDNGG